MMSLYVRDLKKILEGLDDDTVVEIDTVDGIKPVHEVQFQDIEYFCGINSNYEPIESTYPALVLVLGHQVFQEGTISDRELFDFCYEERDPLIKEISFWIKKGLTDDGKRKISRKTADKWNGILGICDGIYQSLTIRRLGIIVLTVMGVCIFMVSNRRQTVVEDE